LKSKEVLLSGIGRGSFRVISWAGLGGWGKKGGIPFIYLFIYPFLIIWWLNKDIFLGKYFKKNQCHFLGASNLEKFHWFHFFLKKKILFEIKDWIHLTKNWKKIQYQLFVWQIFWCKWPKKNVYQYIYQIDIYWSENEKNGLYNGKNVET